MKETTGGCAVLHWVILILCQGLEEKPNSPLKAFKAAVFILAQLDYEAIIQMAMPANLNKKYMGKRSRFAQISFDQTTPGGSWTDQAPGRHCRHNGVKSSAPWQGSPWVADNSCQTPGCAHVHHLSVKGSVSAHPTLTPIFQCKKNTSQLPRFQQVNYDIDAFAQN